MRQRLSRNIQLARATAPPDITILREAKMPKLKAVLRCRRGARDPRRVDAELLGGHPRQGRLQS
jgi:hypothetical protein